MNVAFTIGNRVSYDRDLAQRVVHKIGKRDDYDGGWVWRTREEAEEFIRRVPQPFDAKVYALLLPRGWKEDVSAEPAADGVHRLLQNARIVQLESLVEWRWSSPEHAAHVFVGDGRSSLCFEIHREMSVPAVPVIRRCKICVKKLRKMGLET